MKRLAIVGAVVVAALVLLAVLGALSGDDPGPGPDPAARCDPATTHPVSGASEHRNPPISYDRTPPNSGPHMTTWLNVLKRRYDVVDAVQVERVVHNLEHGWVVVWYQPAADLAALDRALADVNPRKIVAIPWTDGGLPAPYVLSAWGAEHRCTSVSTAALEAFFDAHGGDNGAAPEPGAP